MNQERKYIIGIDPSFTNFGVCIYNPKTKSFNLKTGNMSEMVKWIQTQVKLKECVAIVENPALNSNVFKMWPMVKKEIDKMVNYEKNRFKKVVPKGSISDVQSTFLMAMKFAQNVGENKAAAKQIIMMLADAKVPTLEIAPSQRDKAYKKVNGKTQRKDVRFLKMPTKTTQAQFKEITDYEGRSNEHARDAATLCINQTVSGVLASIEMSIGKFKKQPSRPKTSNDNWFIVSAKV